MAFLWARVLLFDEQADVFDAQQKMVVQEFVQSLISIIKLRVEKMLN